MDTTRDPYTFPSHGTTHGAGDEWTMTCGLGQGSVLAALKWNLFLDLLLKRMDNTRDPYTFTSQGNTHELRIAAFADDTTIIASTHEGYVKRMNMAIEYFSYFGVTFSPSKTHYTYAPHPRQTLRLGSHPST